MANAHGGTVVIGVSERTSSTNPIRHSIATGLMPVSNLAETASKLSAFLAQNVRPRLPGCEVIPIQDSHGHDAGYLAIVVDESPRGHMSSDGRYYRRHSFGVMPIEDRELRELLSLTPRADLEAVVMLDPFDAADPASIHQTEFMLGIRNTGSAAESLYRMTFELVGAGLEGLYGPDGNFDREHHPRQIGRQFVFVGGPKYAAFPGTCVPCLHLRIARGASDAAIVWTLSGATTPIRSGRIVLGEEEAAF